MLYLYIILDKYSQFVLHSPPKVSSYGFCYTCCSIYQYQIQLLKGKSLQMLKLHNQNNEEPVSSKTPHQSRVSYNLHIDRSHLSHSQIVLCIILSRMKSVNVSKMYK